MQTAEEGGGEGGGCTAARGGINGKGKCQFLREMLNSNLGQYLNKFDFSFPDCQKFCGFSQLEITYSQFKSLFIKCPLPFHQLNSSLHHC